MDGSLKQNGNMYMYVEFFGCQSVHHNTVNRITIQYIIKVKKKEIIIIIV